MVKFKINTIQKIFRLAAKERKQRDHHHASQDEPEWGSSFDGLF
jgi:hypothetical protein